MILKFQRLILKRKNINETVKAETTFHAMRLPLFRKLKEI